LQKSMDRLKAYLEKIMEGLVKKQNIFNLEDRMEKKMEECMEHMGQKMEENIKEENGGMYGT
jgi:hypothetical protein